MSDCLIDRFVEKVNTGYREPIILDIDDTPPSVLVGEPDESGCIDWMIKPYTNVDWIEPLEEKLGHKLPIAYRSLLTRYIFPAFEFSDLWFFANTPEGTDYYELRDRIFCDEALFKSLWPAGFIQFANPAGGNYDPVCFDLNHGSKNDCPIVQIDHEGILCYDTIKIVKQIARSFRDFLESAIAADLS